MTPHHDEKRRNLTVERDDDGHRVIMLNTIKVWHAIVTFIVSVSVLLGGVWGIVRTTVNGAIDRRIVLRLEESRPEMISAAEHAHNLIRSDLENRITVQGRELAASLAVVAKDLTDERESRKEGQQEIRTELQYIRSRVDYLVARER